ncbi:unnamed protein product [Cuscuta campestris]|uniref:PHD-type domain-containing protein n=1 Tax=Cuscuta campestris TaxID=132261 RepID=A0A484M1C7_9ASTE|nr:unnamed protein product [Cuscuta campestris]
MSSTQDAVELSTKHRVAEKKPETIELVQCHSGEDSFKCSVEFHCQYTESKLLGQSMVEEFGSVSRISPDCMSMDSNQEQMRPDECGENAMIGVNDFSSVNETTDFAVEYSTEPLRELHDQCHFFQSQDHVGFTNTIESSTENQGVLPTGHISTDSITASNQEQKRSDDCRENAMIGEMDFSSVKETTNSAVVYSEEPLKELNIWYQNPQSQDRLGITNAVESSSDCQGLPTRHIFTDSVIEQNNLPFKNCRVNSNTILSLPSENKDTTSQVDHLAESPRDLFEDLVLKQIKETPKFTVENHCHPLEHKSEIDENLDEIMVVESVFKEDLLLHGDASVNSSQEQSGSRLEDLGVKSSLNNIEVLDERGEAILIANHSVGVLGDASESTGQELRDGYQNAQSQDCVAITDTIESSSECQGVSPTGHIVTDSIIDQKNLPFENCGVNSNSIMALRSEYKDTTSQIDRSAESPRDVFEDLVLKQIQDTAKSTVENPSHPLEHRSKINGNIDEIMVVESVCKEDLLLCGDASVNSSREQSGSRLEGLGVNSSFNNFGVLDERGEAIPIANSVVVLGVASESTGQEIRETYRDSNVNPSQLECGDESHSEQSRTKISSLRSPVTSTRVLRSRTQEKTKSPETTNASAADNSKKEKKRKRRKRKQRKQIAANELLGIKSHLKYLVRRILYEQSLIDAYSGEGWKGQSLEKIKPEKELQRAKSGIFHYKLKVRELFSRIDASLFEGQFPESLFDSEGQIDSEDIFCAKCSSKNVSSNNDIILCDGACERGFHQKCLEPPLLKEDFPPDDEGWLCPGCDCKVDCVDLLNDLLGTDLSITDSWEKVFQEEAAASGKQLDDMVGLPSDDSEDDDYNPDNLEVDEKISEDDESNSDDESDSSDTSFELETPNDELFLGLPSEDSEDDDYEPDAHEHDEQIMQYSSSSDFTSDSEDFSVELKNIMSPGQEDHYEKIEVGGGPHSLKGEVEFLMQSYETLASGKRHVERLDYKKLHDETFGVASSDSSDEDYEDISASKNRKKRSDKAALKSSDQSPVDTTVKNASRTSSKKRKAESLVESESGSGSKRNTRLKYGDDVIKRLYESFKENHYPKREVKESLAKELGLAVQQVNKWFNNTRWSFNHLSPQTKNVMPAVEEHANVDTKVLPKENKPKVDKKKSSLPVRRRNRLKV